MFADHQCQFLFRDLANGRGEFASAAVKYGQRIARPESQYATYVARLVVAERQLCIRT
jgi:hypothetical protein